MITEIKIWCWQCSECNYSCTQKSVVPELPHGWKYKSDDEHGDYPGSPLCSNARHFCTACVRKLGHSLNS